MEHWPASISANLPKSTPEACFITLPKLLKSLLAFPVTPLKGPIHSGLLIRFLEVSTLTSEALIQNLIMAAEHININSWQHRRVIFGTGAMLLLILLIRTGWAAEDAYISFRVVDNFLTGYGLTWNPGERVQVYTDPLFVFLQIAGAWISGDVYWASVIISLLLTVGAYFLLMYQQTGSAMVVGTAILLSSKAFMDFSVSGLENPATHFGIAAFCWAYWRKQSALVLTLIASLTAVNRLDSFLLFVPALLLVYYRLGWQAWKPVMLGLTPLIGWEMFSLFYYGFPFPNTAYAKLNTGVSSGELIRQGVAYLSNDYHWDKVTAIVIVAGILSGLWNTDWPLALGVLASVLYVVRVGGDFMSGRFLSPALFLACGLIVRRTRLRWPATLGIATAILLLGLRNPRPTLTTTSNFGVGLPTPMSHGIADERAFFYGATGLLRWHNARRWPDSEWTDIGEQFRKSGLQVVPVTTAGVIPYHAGPKVYALDVGALGDPLLARLRLPPTPSLRPGHYFRLVPAGYVETLSTGENRIQDPKLARYYERLRTVVRGKLWSVQRMKEIVAINLGH